MGLIDRLDRSAARHAHVLVIEVPGHWQTRAAVEQAALVRGWNLALSPADADVLAVCGEPGPQLDEAVEQVWHQIPGPRVRVDVRRHDDAAARLKEAHAGLLDTTRHRNDAHSRPTAADLIAENKADDHGDMDHADMDMSPGGIPLADGERDRDGLEMDVLHVRLGPILPHWPAGLVLDCALQGDVITEAEAELLDDGMPPPGGPSAALPRRLDNMVALLALAGWDDAAAEARAIRECLLVGGEDAMTFARIARLVRRVRRSWVLRWSLRGVRPLSEADLRRCGLPTTLAGDTHDRLLCMLEGAATGVVGAHLSTHHLPGLVTGLDLATARLVLASLDLHELRPGHAEHETPHV